MDCRGCCRTVLSFKAATAVWPGGLPGANGGDREVLWCGGLCGTFGGEFAGAQVETVKILSGCGSSHPLRMCHETCTCTPTNHQEMNSDAVKGCLRAAKVLLEKPWRPLYGFEISCAVQTLRCVAAVQLQPLLVGVLIFLG